MGDRLRRIDLLVSLAVLSLFIGSGLVIALSSPVSWLGWALVAAGVAFFAAWLTANHLTLRVLVVSDEFAPLDEGVSIGEIDIELHNRSFTAAVDVTGFRLRDIDSSVPHLIQRPDAGVAEELARRFEQRGTWGGLIRPRKRVQWRIVAPFANSAGRPGYLVIVEDANYRTYIGRQQFRPLRHYVREI